MCHSAQSHSGDAAVLLATARTHHHRFKNRQIKIKKAPVFCRNLGAQLHHDGARRLGAALA
jgi:hypothetical protein